MTSKDIEQDDPTTNPMTGDIGEVIFWIKEIAYQLAVMNEQKAQDLNEFLKAGKPL